MPALGRNWVLCLKFVLFCLSTTVAQQLFYEGDTCTATGGVEGVCVELSTCPEVISQIRNRVFPVNCNWSGGKNIICCPKSTTDTTTTRTHPPPATTPITATEIQIRRFEEMCLKSARYVFWNTSICFMDIATPIVGGPKAEPMEFPHMVALGYGDRSDIAWLCGGSLISERFVLTAAHCLSARGSEDVRWVRMGDLNLQSETDDETAVTMEVEEAIRHEHYNPPAHYNDIALIKLKNEVTFTPNIWPACLYSEPGNPSDSKATALGWGQEVGSSDNGTENLMRVDLNLLPPNDCNDTLRSTVGTEQLVNGITDDSMICAAAPRDICQDYGGPLQIRLGWPRCMYGIIGLKSFGTSVCEISPSASVFTRVSNYLNWIEGHVWP